MLGIIRIRVPLPHIGHVNTWLLRGDPLALVDTGPREDAAIASLEAGLARAGCASRTSSSCSSPTTTSTTRGWRPR